MTKATVVWVFGASFLLCCGAATAAVATDACVKTSASWADCSSVRKLRELARSPFDLTEPNAVTADRITKLQLNTCGLKLLYGTERVCPDTLNALSDLAKERGALAKMKAMQDGEVINKIEGYDCENRRVLHTAMRDVFEKSTKAPPSQEAADLEKIELEKLKKWCHQLDEEKKFTDLLLIGIGGSDLGPRALYMALQGYRVAGRRVHIVSNVDPDDAAGVLRNIPDLSKTMVLVVSKSGGTLETLTNEMLVRDAFKKAGLEPKQHFACVTGKGSPMDSPSEYLASFYMYDYIGGRFSATSMVGGPMLAFALGYNNFELLLKGAHDMDKAALNPDPLTNMPLLLALLIFPDPTPTQKGCEEKLALVPQGIWNRNFLGLPTLAVLPYSQALLRFTAHLQQLDMESNGKHIDTNGRFVEHATGPIIWGEPGTNGQHSFYQLIHQGTDVIPCEFIGFTESQLGQDLDVKGTTSQQKLVSNLLAQSLAMATGTMSANPNKCFDGNRPNCLLLAKKLDPYTLGALLALYEHKVAFQGFLWGINSFDQEGVQLGKTLATQFLEVFKAANSGQPVEPKDSITALFRQMP